MGKSNPDSVPGTIEQRLTMATQPAKDSLSHDPLINETVGGRYRIERLIGRGGVGLVYLADDTDHPGKKVVVKMLAPHWAEDRDAVARFDREAKRMERLDHPNVVKMFGHGRHGEAAYIVMEFLDGEPLRRYLNRHKALPFDEFIPIASQVLAGVGYVHARDTMLRDIKPPNIMLCERDGKANHVKLLDFGLAKLIEEENEITKAHVIGTAGYLAPEQIKGEPTDVRVDVYALGILFFIMLVGESPIVGENDGAILFNHVHGTPKNLRDLLPDGHGVPDSVIDLVHQCLEKEPDARPQDANEMAEILFETVHPSLFVLPDASPDTRKHAEQYWRERMKRGANAISLDDEEEDVEQTNPVKKRTLAEARDAVDSDSADEAAEKSEAADKAKHPAVPRAVPPPKKGRTLPPSPPPALQSGKRRTMPPPPPPSRRPLVSGTQPPVPPVRKPASGKMPPPPRRAVSVAPMAAGRPGSTVPPGQLQAVPDPAPSASETLTGMPKMAPSDVDPTLADAANESEAIKQKRTIMGIPRPAVPDPSEPPPSKPAPQVVVGPDTPAPGAVAAMPGQRVRKNRVPTIGTAVLKANADRRKSYLRGSAEQAQSAGELEPDTNRVEKESAAAAAASPSAELIDAIPIEVPPDSAPFVSPLNEVPRGRTIAMDAEDVKRAAIAGAGASKREDSPLPTASSSSSAADSKSLGLDLLAEDTAAAAALMASTPAVDPPSNTRFSLLLVVGGIAALALGSLTAWIALGGNDGDSSNDTTVAAASAEPGEDKDDNKTEASDATEEPPKDEPRVIQVAQADGPKPGGDGAKPEAAVKDDAVTGEVGSLELTSVDGATVVIDGEDVGSAPFTGDLPAGTHEVQVSAPGHDDWEETVEITAGGKTSLEASLRRRRSGQGGTKRHNQGTKHSTPSKPEPPPPTEKPDPTPSEPAKDPKKDPKKGDVFMNTDNGKPSGGIFLPVGKDK